ncbi:hypothetical protein SUGI_0270060 [Cryptomeria japonica]|nr:hypothetical protein SUGI_0270060 [Cryptomeria japonica]
MRSGSGSGSGSKSKGVARVSGEVAKESDDNNGDGEDVPHLCLVPFGTITSACWGVLSGWMQYVCVWCGEWWEVWSFLCFAYLWFTFGRLLFCGVLPTMALWALYSPLPWCSLWVFFGQMSLFSASFMFGAYFPHRLGLLFGVRVGAFCSPLFYDFDKHFVVALICIFFSLFRLEKLIMGLVLLLSLFPLCQSYKGGCSFYWG